MSINMHLINESRAQIVETAKMILATDISYVDGARIICPLLYEARIDPHAKPFVAFIAIDSEAESFPFGDARKKWNSEALAKLDAELAEIEDWARGFGEDACREIVASPELAPLAFR